MGVPAVPATLHNGGARLTLTAEGSQALATFEAGEARSLDGKYVFGFMDGDGGDRGFAHLSSPRTLREFVRFSGIQPGMAVVEVGAGTGRLTFEGGLAETVGPQGLILATDPSAPWLGVVENKRREHRASASVRALVARAEHIPVQDRQADLVIGSKFLQYCEDKRATLIEMARVTRPGGIISVLVALQALFGSGWTRVLAPLIAAGRAHGNASAERSLLAAPGETEALFRDIGFSAVLAEPFNEPNASLDYATTLRFLSQTSALEAIVATVPDPERTELLNNAYTDIRAMFEETVPADRSFVWRFEFVQGRV